MSGSTSNLTRSDSAKVAVTEFGRSYPCLASDYDVVEEIGTGAFAKVYRALVKSTGENVAIKIMDLDQLDTSWDEVRKEIATMSFLHHPNMVHIYTSFVVGADLWIVMPLLEGGSCAHIMKLIAPKGFKDEALIVTILYETLKGLHYLHHTDGRIHRDVKAGNILIGSDGRVQLADFGVATKLVENGDRKKNRQTFTGTPCWMAPEVMEHGSSGYDEKADIWSFGITALELAFGRAPYSKFQPMKVMLLTLQEEPPTVEIYNDNSYTFSKNFKSLVEKCLRKDAKKRPNAKKLLEHKIFKDAKDMEYVRLHTIAKLPPKTRIEEFERPRIPGVNGDSNSNNDEAGPGPSTRNKPISVGSFVFDPEEFIEFKNKHGPQVKQEHEAYLATLNVPGKNAANNNNSNNDHSDDESLPQDGQHIQSHSIPLNIPTSPSDQLSQAGTATGLFNVNPIPNDPAAGQGEGVGPLAEVVTSGRFTVSDENENDDPDSLAFHSNGPVFHQQTSDHHQHHQNEQQEQVGRFAVNDLEDND